MANRMADMIQDLVESAHLEAGDVKLRKERVDLSLLVSDLVERSVAVDERRRVKLEIEGDVPAVLAEPQRLERALTNIITNALKYSPREKAVVVRLELRQRQVVITVTDQGEGIAPDDLPHIFDRHFRAKTAGKREGLGLGLYITRLIVEAHGGHVCVDSLVGKGSSFYFSLPVCP